MKEQLKISTNYQVPILSFLYSFKNDSEYHLIPDSLIKSIDNEFQALNQLFVLSSNDLAQFQTLPNINQPTWTFITDYGIENPRYDDFKDIKGKITAQGIKIVEAYLANQQK